MAQEPAGLRVGDDGALVADGGIVEPGLFEVREDGAVHASRDDEDVDAGSARPRDRRRGARTQHGVLGDQRPVEVACEGRDPVRESGGELYGSVVPGFSPVVALTT
jgi:hypothetical protein